VTEDALRKARLRPWWERWPGLLEQELARFDHHGLPVTVVENPLEGDRRLVVETTMDLPGRGPTRLVVVYPDGFPDRRFAIFAPDLRLGRHQAFGGNLCVLPRESVHWDPWFAAADMIVERVPRLVELVDAGGDVLREAEDPQGEPVTTYYESHAQGGVVFDDRMIVESIAAAAGGVLELLHAADVGEWLLPHPNPKPEDWAPATGLIYLAGVRDHAGNVLTAEVSAQIKGQFRVEREGIWTFVEDPPYATSAEELWDFLVSHDARVAEWAARVTGLQTLGMCTREEVRQGEYELTWVFVIRQVERGDSRTRDKQSRSGNPAVRAAPRVHPPVIVRGLRRTEDSLAARIPELSGLRAKRAAVVGLGTLGGPLAQELAKARIGRISLVDRDFVDPATAVRYPFSLPDAGVNKAMAYARWIAFNHPEVTASWMVLNIGSTPLEDPAFSEAQFMADLLDGCDLLISATAENDVNRQLDTFARELGVPRLYLYSQSGYGGIVVLLTEETGCYHCLEVFLSEQAQAGSPLVEVPPDGPHGLPAGTIQSPGCSDKTFTAPHADLLPIAIHAARVAYGFLSDVEEGGYPRMDGDLFAVQIRETDGTPIPPRWSVHSLEPNPECRICNAS
jgi:hypothetical protein